MTTIFFFTSAVFFGLASSTGDPGCVLAGCALFAAAMVNGIAEVATWWAECGGNGEQQRKGRDER